jgi:hypothetical protein
MSVNDGRPEALGTPRGGNTKQSSPDGSGLHSDRNTAHPQVTSCHTVDVAQRPRSIVSVVPAWRTGVHRRQLVAWCHIGGRWHRHYHGACLGKCDSRQTGVCTCPLGSGDGHRASTCTPLGYVVREQPGSPPVWLARPAAANLGMIEVTGVGDPRLGVYA